MTLENYRRYGIPPPKAVLARDRIIMTPDEFRALATSFPQVRYATNMGAIHLLTGDKMFATIGGPDPGLAIVKLSPADQAAAIASSSLAFFPHPGGAGARGVTCVRLSHATIALASPVVKAALTKASRRATLTLAPTRR